MTYRQYKRAGKAVDKALAFYKRKPSRRNSKRLARAMKRYSSFYA